MLQHVLVEWYVMYIFHLLPVFNTHSVASTCYVITLSLNRKFLPLFFILVILYQVPSEYLYMFACNHIAYKKVIIHFLSCRNTLK